VRTRAPRLTRLCIGLLAGGLSVGAAVAVVRIALDGGSEPAAAEVGARRDLAETSTPGSVARVRDAFDSERDVRRTDLAVLAALLLVAAGTAWWVARRLRTARVTVRPAFTARPRAPPRPPALVCT
jgi:hypothetical protein